MMCCSMPPQNGALPQHPLVARPSRPRVRRVEGRRCPRGRHRAARRGARRVWSSIAAWVRLNARPAGRGRGSIGLAGGAAMTDATAVPVNLFENDRELMVVAPMPGVAPEDISIDVTDDGRPHAPAAHARRGPGADPLPRSRVVLRALRADDRAALPGRRDARQRDVRQRRRLDHVPEGRRHGAGRVLVQRTGHARGVAVGPRAATRGGADDDRTPRRSRDPLLPAPRQGRASRAPRTTTPASSPTKGAHALRAAAPLWRRLNLRPDVVLSSPLPRALQTAELFCEAVGGEPQVDDRLRPGAAGATWRGPWPTTPMRDA